MLIRLAAVGVLWDSGRRTSVSIRISILGVGMIALVRLPVATAGGPAMWHMNVAATTHIFQ